MVIKDAQAPARGCAMEGCATGRREAADAWEDNAFYGLEEGDIPAPKHCISLRSDHVLIVFLTGQRA